MVSPLVVGWQPRSREPPTRPARASPKRIQAGVDALESSSRDSGGVFVLFFIHRLEFDGIGGDHLEIAATLRAGDDLAFINLVFLNVQISLAFRTVHHDSSTLRILLYLVSSRAKSRGSQRKFNMSDAPRRKAMLPDLRLMLE